MVSTETLAYLAGAIDSDGCISMKRSTYHMRVRKDSTNPVFSERIMLKQVTPQIPELLHATFGGSLKLQAPSCKVNGRALWSWSVTDKAASEVASQLLPYLLVKRRQAEIVLELRVTKGGQYSKLSYWFALENPDWRNSPMITRRQAAEMIGYKNPAMIGQAVRNGSLLALPYDHSGQESPRIPLALVMAYRNSDGPALKMGRVRPPQLIAWRERLYSEIKSLNKIGVNGTAVTNRTGCHTPA